MLMSVVLVCVVLTSVVLMCFMLVCVGVCCVGVCCINVCAQQCHCVLVEALPGPLSLKEKVGGAGAGHKGWPVSYLTVCSICSSFSVLTVHPFT